MADDYRRSAVIKRWVDGDTVDLVVDLGFRLSFEDRFRLIGVDTPERGQPGYKEAITFVNKMAPAGTVVEADTYKAREKYGRWLCDIYVLGTLLNAELIDEGLAKPYDGGTKSV